MKRVIAKILSVDFINTIVQLEQKSQNPKSSFALAVPAFHEVTGA